MTISPDWRTQLDPRQQKEIAFSEEYAKDPFGLAGSNSLVLIAKLAELLDIAAGIKEPPDPHNPILTFGKYNGKRLSELVQLDRGYVEWLSGEARDHVMREAAAAILRASPAPPLQILPRQPEPPEQTAAPLPAEPGEDIPY